MGQPPAPGRVCGPRVQGDRGIGGADGPRRQRVGTLLEGRRPGTRLEHPRDGITTLKAFHAGYKPAASAISDYPHSPTVLKAGAPLKFPNEPDRTGRKHSVPAIAWLSSITEIPHQRLTLHLEAREIRGLRSVRGWTRH